MALKILRAYTRKSIYDENTSDRFARDRQRNSIETWAAIHGPYQIVWYEDLDVSGLKEANRSGWLKLVADLDPVTDYAVIVEDYDRSHRNVRDALSFFDDILAPYRIRYISVTNNLDLSTPDGRAWFINRMNQAEYEARKARDRMEKTIKYKTEKLGRHWGRNPFGCDREEKSKQLIPTRKFYFYNPVTDEAQIGKGETPAGFEIRYFFDALHSLFHIHSRGDYSLNDTAIAANKAGWRHWTHDGTPVPFNRIDINRILRAWRLYAGELPPGYSARNKRPILAGGHQPILPVELCYKVGEVLEQRHHIRVPQNLMSSIYLLSGIARCGHCGNRLTGQPMNNHRDLYYRHSDTKVHDCPERMVRCEIIDSSILAMLNQLVGLNEIIKQVASRVYQALTLSTAIPDTVSVLQAKKEQLERLIDLHLLGKISQEQYLKRQDVLQAEIDDLESRTTAQGTIANLEQEVMAVMTNITRLNDAPIGDKRLIILKIIDRILVKDSKVIKIIPTKEASPLFSLCQALPKSYIQQRDTLTILELMDLPKHTDILV